MRLKAAWEVHAGLIPMQSMEEFTKIFPYTSEDYEEDRKNEDNFKDPENIKQKTVGYAFHSRFSKIRAEAIDYYLQLNSPQILNWAQITFIWY